MLFEGYKPVHEFSYFSMECFNILEVVTKSRDSLLITAPVLVPGEEDCEFIYYLYKISNKIYGKGKMIDE